VKYYTNHSNFSQSQFARANFCLSVFILRKEANQEVRQMGKLAEEKVFKDPVHKYIYVQDRIVWDLINTPEFQRLRRIRQLGTTYLTFHGAEHSRFSHSMGVYEIARNIISRFERNGYARFTREEKLLCLCAALLHDVGHAPFSHSVEPFLADRHEVWSCRIILEDTAIHRLLKEVSDDFPQQVAGVLRKTHPDKLAVSLISSQLDADRMDYLLRDAYFTGVNYGTFELERILRVMRPHGGRIVVKESGMHAVEDYLMSRYQMYWQVYFHPVTRGSEVLLRNVLRRAADLHRQGYAFRFLPDPLPALFEGRMDVESYLGLDESFLQMTFMRWIEERDRVLSDLSSRFINRRLFKYHPIRDGQEDEAEQMRERAAAAGWDPDYYVEVDRVHNQPYDVYRPGGEEGSMPILLADDAGNLAEISTRSHIVRSISETAQREQHLYYPGELVSRGT
jgi:hypothetical protein